MRQDERGKGTDGRPLILCFSFTLLKHSASNSAGKDLTFGAEKRNSLRDAF